MNIKLLATLTLVSTAALLVAQKPASAINFTSGGTAVSGQGLETSVVGATTIDLNNGFPTTGNATFTGYNSTSLVTGGKVNDHGNPAGDNSQYMTITPVGYKNSGATGSVTINFANAIDYFGMYWGSADNYNQISFYNGSTLLATYGGGDLAGKADGSWTGSEANFFANFYADPGQDFTSVKLSATGVAFESDNYAYKEAVPEPATILGTIGFGAFAAYSRKRKQQA